MFRFFIILVLISFFSNVSALVDSLKILTPGYENIVLAKINGVEVKEFDVFGIPDFSKSRNNISNSKRSGKIKDHILDVIFQTEGNISEIINSQGYKRTFKLLLKKIAVDLFREDIIKEELKRRNDLKKSNKKGINQYVHRILDSLKNEYNVKYNEKLLSDISNINISDPYKFVDSLFIIGVKKELITFKDQKVTVKDLAIVVKQLKPYHMSNLKKISVLKSLIDGKILNELLVEVAGSKGYFEDERVNSVVIDQIKYFVSSEYKKRLFSLDNIKLTKDELIDYYIEHKDDAALKTRKKMWTYEIFKFYDNSDESESNDKIKVAIELENIRQKILSGESFEKYAKFYARPDTRDGELGYIYRTDYARIGEIADKLKANDMSELIIQKKAISIIKVTEVKKPRLFKFDDVEEIVKNRVLDKKRDELKNELRRKLFKKYKVELLYAQ